MTYQVHLAVFEGPFDLLLHLISKRQVDVMEVDLADITADFLSSLDGIAEVDLETATRFLVVAATLVELKAARLLPRDEDDEFEDLLADARDMLYARLLEYRAFRQVAGIIRDRLAANEGHHTREVVLDPDLARLVPDVDLPLDAVGLARMAAIALEPRPVEHVDLSHLRQSSMTVRDAAASLLARIPQRGARTTFRDLSASRPTSERVVLFLAMLELYKLGQLDLVQPDLRGPIVLERTAEGGDLSVIVDDYDAVEPTDDEGDAAREAAELVDGDDSVDGDDRADLEGAPPVLGEASTHPPTEPSDG